MGFFAGTEASPSPLGALVEQGTTLPVSVRVGEARLVKTNWINVFFGWINLVYTGNI
jgi:hypothetical protein